MLICDVVEKAQEELFMERSQFGCFCLNAETRFQIRAIPDDVRCLIDRQSLPDYRSSRGLNIEHNY